MAVDIPLPRGDKSNINKLADTVEYFLFGVFLVEAVLKIVAQGLVLHPFSYLRNIWNVLDFVALIVGGILLFFQGDQSYDVKMFKVIRILRPLKLVYGIPPLEVVVSSIARALIPLFQTLVLVVFVIVIFAIVGLQFMYNRFHHSCYNQKGKTDGTPCDAQIHEALVIHGDTCPVNTTCREYSVGLNHGITSFDNIFLAMITVFECITTDSWTTIMYHVFRVIDTGGYLWSMYFVFLIVIGAFFMLNLVLGVLSGKYVEEREKVLKKREYIKMQAEQKLKRLTDGYLDWISKADDILIEEAKESTEFHMITAPVALHIHENNKKGDKKEEKRSRTQKRPGKFMVYVRYVRLKLRKKMKTKKVFWFVMFMVLMNALLMATEHYNQPEWLSIVQVYGERFFVTLFTIELLINVFAFGAKYFQSKFHCFEILVIILSILELVILETQGYNRNNSGFGFSVLRSLRLLRAFKVTEYWPLMKNLVTALLNATKAILSLTFLLMLFLITAALLGMQLFGGRYGELETYPRTNFETFENSLIAVFQIITGDAWSSVMHDGMMIYGGPNTIAGIASSLYFILVVVFGNYVLLNVFLVITVDNLANAQMLSLDEHEEKERLKEEKEKRARYKENVLKNWMKIDPESRKVSIGINDGQRQQIALSIGSESDLDQTEIEEEIRKHGLLATMKVNMATRRHKRKQRIVNPASSLFVFSSRNCFRKLVHRFVNTIYFDWFVLLVVVMSTIVLSLDKPSEDENDELAKTLDYLDYFFTCVFGLEAILKIIAYGFVLHKGAYLRNPWNVLDFFVFTCSLVSDLMSLMEDGRKSDNIGSYLELVKILKVLRPLKAIQKIKKLKIVFHCMFFSLKNVAFILIISALLLFIFGCIGVQLFNGKFYSCSDKDVFSEKNCKGYYYDFYSYQSIIKVKPNIKERIWSRHDFHFDNIFSAMLTLYSSSTGGWLSIMHQTIDAASGAKYDDKRYIALYYILFIIIFTFIIINIYIALIILTFQSQGEKHLREELSRNQQECVKFVVNSKLIKQFQPDSRKSLTYYIWLVVDSQYFDYFTKCVIIIDTIQLMMKYNGSPDLYVLSLRIVNYTVTIIYSIELMMKIIVYKLKFFTDWWNLFDFAITLGNIGDIVLSLGLIKNIDRNMLKFSRCGRTIKLIRQNSSIRLILWTFTQSFKALPYVLSLLLMLFYIYAILGMQLFGTMQWDNTYQEGQDGEKIFKYNNFSWFLPSLMVLFRCATGDGWSSVLAACLKCKGSRGCPGEFATTLYFTTFNFFSMFFLLNLFVAVIMDNFEYLTQDKSILGPHHLIEFLASWSTLDKDATGELHHDRLYELMCSLPPPAGFGDNCPKDVAYRQFIYLNIPVDKEGHVKFRRTLISLVCYRLEIKLSEIRKIMKVTWPKMSKELLDEIIPKREERGLTLGQIYCAKLMVVNHRKKKEHGFSRIQNKESGTRKGKKRISRVFSKRESTNMEDKLKESMKTKGLAQLETKPSPNNGVVRQRKPKEIHLYVEARESCCYEED